jgi:HAD superfamily hydrolase (TIGR01549 family)
VIKAVMFDLDNTLLRNPTPEFVAAYVEGVSRFFTARGGVEPSEALRQSVQIMMNGPRRIWQSNLELYWELLHPIWFGTPEELTHAFDAFYSDEYAALKSNTSPAPMAGEVIDRVRGEGYKIIIATNPVYPAEAIRHRLAWADLPSDLGYYDFVTTADNMHFAKPDPAYYAEILARAGLEPDEAVMIGDEPRYDVAVSKIIGMHAYNLTWETLGTLLDLLPILPTLLPNPITPEAIVPQWRGNLGALFGTISDMPAHFWDQHPFENEWSPLEIVCHLRDYESAVHRARLMRILNEENPFIAQSPQPPPPGQMDDCAGDGLAVAHCFLEERLKTIEFIEGLTSDDWQRPARHSVFGPTTLLEMAYFTAQHDRLHLRQLCQTIGGCE